MLVRLWLCCPGLLLWLLAVAPANIACCPLLLLLGLLRLLLGLCLLLCLLLHCCQHWQQQIHLCSSAGDSSSCSSDQRCCICWSELLQQPV